MVWGQSGNGGGFVFHNCCKVAGVIAEKVRVMFHSLVFIVIITTTITTVCWQGLGQGQEIL